jgi:hypothetical protein
MTGCYELPAAVSIPNVTKNKDKLGSTYEGKRCYLFFTKNF